MPEDKINYEQELCKICGLCCDGTIFKGAYIINEMDLERSRSFNLSFDSTKDNKIFFKLPCHHFNGICTIYHVRRPHICGSFYCDLIVKLRKKEMKFDKVKEIIEETVDKSKTIKQYLLNHKELSCISIYLFNERLIELEKENEDMVSIRRKYGKLIIHNYTLNKLLKKYFIVFG